MGFRVKAVVPYSSSIACVAHMKAAAAEDHEEEHNGFRGGRCGRTDAAPLRSPWTCNKSNTESKRIWHMTQSREPFPNSVAVVVVVRAAIPTAASRHMGGASTMACQQSPALLLLLLLLLLSCCCSCCCCRCPAQGSTVATVARVVLLSAVVSLCAASTQVPHWTGSTPRCTLLTF